MSHGLRLGAGALASAVLFAIPAGGIWVTALETNVSNVLHTAFTVDDHRLPNTYVGNDGNAAAWTRIATGQGASAMRDAPSAVTFDRPFHLANGRHGIALHHVLGSPAYTDGTGSNQNYANADLALQTGLVRAGAFSGTVFTPCVWNGSIHYDVVPNPPSFVTYGTSCPGTNGLPQIGAGVNSAPRLGTGFGLLFANLPFPPRPFSVLIGASRTTYLGLTLPFDMNAVNMTGCTLYASGEMSVGGVNTGGFGLAVVAIPANLSLLGVGVYLQGVLRDPGANPFGATLTNAAQILIGM